MIELEVTIPKSDAMKRQLHTALRKRPSPIFKGVVASRDFFWQLLSRRYLRARSRADKTRLMRDTGALVQSYFPEQKDGARPIASLDSKSKVAAIHEDTTKSRVMTIRAKGAKALFIPTVTRSVSKGVVPSTSGASIPGGGRAFVFRSVSRVTRRWPSHHLMKRWKHSVIKAGVVAFEKAVTDGWDKGPEWPRERVKK